MSLTSLLKSPSPLRDFFADRFPNTRELVFTSNTSLAASVPRTSGALSRADIAVIGTAFDYRARLYFRPLYLDRVTARHGVLVLDGILPKKVHMRPQKVFEHVRQLLQSHHANSKLLSKAEEDLINGCCLLLAYFEQFYRAWFPPDSNPLFRGLATSRGPEEVWARVCRPVLLEDLRALSSGFYRRWRHEFGKPVVLNPTFAGSKLVGGADADIIIERTLVEFKTSRQERPIDREQLWQILGYVLLDFSDVHRIEAVCFDFARHDVTRSWTVEDLTTALAGSRRPVAFWRREMREVCKTLESFARARMEEEILKMLKPMVPRSRSSHRGAI